MSRLRALRFRRDHRWAPGHMSAFLDGDLVGRSRRRLQEHLTDCPECRAVLKGLEQMLHRLHHLAVQDPSEDRPDIATAVRRRLHEHAVE